MESVTAPHDGLDYDQTKRRDGGRIKRERARERRRREGRRTGGAVEVKCPNEDLEECTRQHQQTTGRERERERERGREVETEQERTAAPQGQPESSRGGSWSKCRAPARPVGHGCGPELHEAVLSCQGGSLLLSPNSPLQLED